MAVDFGILERTPTIGSRFMEGQQAAQQQAERNMLRQMQMQQMAIQQENMLAQRENMAAQREERAAHAEERRAKIAQARAAEARLEQLAQSVGQPVTEESLRKMQADALRSGNPAAVTLIGNIAKDYQTAQEGRRVAALFGPQEMPTGAPTVAPAAPAEAPVNALTAPAAMPTAPAVAAAPPALGARRETVRIGGRDFTEQDLLQLSADPNPRVQAAAKAGLDLMKANKPPTDEAMMTRLGIPLTPEGFARYKSLGQQPALTELAKLQKELADMVAANPSDPRIAEHRAKIRLLTTREPAAQVSVRLPEQEKAERGERGKMLVKDFEVVKKSADQARRVMPAIETNLAVLDQGFKTGFGTEVKSAAASVLSALGVPEAEKFATDAQVFQANVNNAVLGKQLEQKGVQTEADTRRITQTSAQLGNTSEANRFLLSVAKAQAKRDIAQRDFYAKWWKENQTYDGAEDAWATGEGSKSLFDSPELRTYATRTPTRGATTPSSVRSRADAIIRGGG